MIYVVRHGQTDWNLRKRFNGSTDSPLNQTGIMQAEMQAEKLNKISFDISFCSPKKRAVQTCEIICKGNYITDDRLLEINCGEFEGAEETAENMKAFWQAVLCGNNGAEKFSDFMVRNCEFCDMIADNYKGKNILIITHAANVRVIKYYFSGKPKDFDFTKAVAKNGEILIFDN